MRNKKRTIVTILLVTIFIGAVLVLITNKKNAIVQPAPMIVSTTPQNESLYIKEDSDLKIVFQNNISEKEKSDIDIKSEPETRFALGWVSDNILILSSPKGLKNNTKYNISVLYKDRIVKTINFMTNKNSKEELEAQTLEQSQYDYDFNEDLKAVFEEIPWLEKLPIKSSSHTIVYDFNKNSIRIRLLIPNTSSEDDKKSAKQNALESLSNASIDTETIPYHFLYQNE